jgi:hypothetical protein
MAAALLSGERKEVRPPSPDSVPAGAVKIHGNPTTMNLNPLLYANIIESAYLQVQRASEHFTLLSFTHLC